MKLVVTILQNRRVALPYVFLENALPRMRREWEGDIETVLIQHRADASTQGSRFGSLQGDGSEGMERVRRWTDEDGKYDAADEVFVHREIYVRYPSLPSVRYAVEVALDRDADFHLMLEDDALVCDEECGSWPEFFGPGEIGVYRYYHYCNSAFLVMRPPFLRRILPGLQDYDSWNERSRLERFFFRHMRTTRTHLNPAAAVRAHPREFPYTGMGYVADMVRRIAPEKLRLLDIDFGEGASEAPLPSMETMHEHAAEDNSKWSNNLLQKTVKAAEELMMKREGRTNRGPYDGGWSQVLDEEAQRRRDRG
jgi:hypothetical protein